ncbi:MAG: histidine phosphatase family protein [Fuerstiella sp.]|nr:histidine phosphatase family protein [Fuerstiella sp.]
MLKTLFLVRHAKSSWKHPELEDSERPLNKRGTRDAPIMGQRLLARSLVPDLIVSSPAVRALTTAQLLAHEVGYSSPAIVVEDELYAASSQDVLAIVSGLDDRIQVALVVTHNPAITELANWFSDAPIENVPTCGILTVEASEWHRIEAATFADFDYPKKR